MKAIKDFPVIGSSNRALILEIDGRAVFCSTSNYAYLCMDPGANWTVIERPSHEDKNGRRFRETHWVAAFKPQIF